MPKLALSDKASIAYSKVLMLNLCQKIQQVGRYWIFGPFARRNQPNRGSAQTFLDLPQTYLCTRDGSILHQDRVICRMGRTYTLVGVGGAKDAISLPAMQPGPATASRTIGSILQPTYFLAFS